jgi:WS/DGAT/MGAT family acyltransferase
MVASKLHLVPRYRQVVRLVPFELARPLWVDDPHFNLDYHIRHTSLPQPGGTQQLRNLVGRVMAQQLDRAKPLWETWVVEGLADDRWAILSKTHHCMVDGVSGTDLLSVVLDREAHPVREKPEAWRPESPPTDAALVRGALSDLSRSPREQFRALRSAVRRPRRLAGQLLEIAEGLATFRAMARPAGSESSLNGPIGPHRRWTWAETTIDRIKPVRRRFGGTVNDVVLAVISKGFRELLLSRGESVEGRVVRTLVPVSVRSEDERGTYNNRVSAMFAELPVGVADPIERLDLIQAQMGDLKERKQAVAAEALTSLSGYAPPMLLALGARAFARLDQRTVQTVTTNVPGPQFPLYAAGRRMLTAYPYVPLAGSVRIGIAIFSYCGQLTFGVTGDYDSAPDIEVLANAIEEGVTELAARA